MTDPTATDPRNPEVTTVSQPAPVTRGTPRWVTVGLIAMIAAALVAVGGGLAVALGIGRDDPPTAGSADAGFARDMSLHHLQAVGMANVALDRSSDPEVRRLAFDIAESQQNQAGRMQGWLSMWGLPATGGEPMAWMEDMAGMDGGQDMPGGTGAGLMPGMASEAELAELRSLSGRAFDVQFLRLMIRHHQGGSAMANYAAENAEEPAVRNLAGTIAEAQNAERAMMTDMLTARGGTPLPPP